MPSRADLYSKKLGELLLKGWKMLGETCPATDEVPLMQHPVTGRKFSIATGMYVDEMQFNEDGKLMNAPGAAEKAHAQGIGAADAGMKLGDKDQGSSTADAGMELDNKDQGNGTADASMKLDDKNQTQTYSAAATAPRSIVHINGTENATARDESDDWCARMSTLMLKGWTMLGDNCPVTGKVPLMKDPRSGRKFSVATGQYLDEMFPSETSQLADRASQAAAEARSEPPPSAAAPIVPEPISSIHVNTVTGTPVAAHADAPLLTPVDTFVDTPAAAPVSAPGAAPNAAPNAAPVAAATAAAIGAPAAVSTDASLALAAASAALAAQVHACSQLLHASPSPPPPSLVQSLVQCISALKESEEAKWQLRS